jgi:thymidylate synthase (FAD)
MRIIDASYQILNCPRCLTLLETAGRTCYKSEGNGRIDEWSSERFVRQLLDRDPPHESVIEHLSVTVRFTCDRGVSHELVRHRLASFSQESTRYCNYTAGRFGSELTFIRPTRFDEWETTAREAWLRAMEQAETSYSDMISWGLKPEQARSVLPNSLKTEIVMTANLREWRHVFRLRTSECAHPDMRALMVPLKAELCAQLPGVFGASA